MLSSIPWRDRLPQDERSPAEMTQGPGPGTAHLAPPVDLIVPLHVSI